MDNPNLESEAASVILIHGFGFHSFVWAPVARRLSANYKVQRFTLEGYGEPSGPAGRQDSERLAAHEDAHWVGWSMGGLVALRALQRGVNPRSLTLVASAPCMVERPDWPHAIGAAAFRDFRRRLQHNPEEAMRHFAALATHGDERAQPVREQLQAAPIPDEATLERGLDLLEGADARETWAGHPMPRQCILAGHDALLPAGVTSDLAALDPDAGIATVPRAGHALLLSQPDSCAKMLCAFWQSLA